MEIQYRMETDVLVIGMGGAGVRAAIAAADGGARVLLAGKCAFGVSGATFYPGTPGWGMQAVIHEGDTEDYFLEEILDAGAGAADPELAKLLATRSTARFHELEDMGIRFERYEDGRYKGVIPCFGKRLRGSSTLGIAKIRRALWLQLMRRNVRILENTEFICLVKKDGAVVGAVGLDALDQPFYVRAKAVVLATGGGCGIYKYSLATPDETGDGYALALDAGAKLINMEFIQFIPGLTWPVKKLLFQEKNLVTCPKFTNGAGEDILAKYLPKGISEEACLTERAKHGPFTTADISFWLDLAMYEEAAAGRACESGGIHVAYDPKVLEDKSWVITSWLEWMNSRGVRPVEEGFDMIPHAQCFNGGVYIDKNASSGVPGLFAAGETAGGAHGADRLGGAAIAATQVFGALAGERAAEYCAGCSAADVSGAGIGDQLHARFGEARGTLADIPKTMEEIRDVMWRCGAIVRSAERCGEGLARLAELESAFSPALQYERGADVRRVGDLVSYLALSKLLLTVMDQRKESRGPHYRSDFPEPRPEFRGAITVKKEGGGLRTELVTFGKSESGAKA